MEIIRSAHNYKKALKRYFPAAIVAHCDRILFPPVTSGLYSSHDNDKSETE
jgi:hypothetical protein